MNYIPDDLLPEEEAKICFHASNMFNNDPVAINDLFRHNLVTVQN